MSVNVDPRMIKLLNSGDKRELRAFLTLYAKPIYDRAFAITNDEVDAKRVTRRVIAEITMLAAKGELSEDVDGQLMKLTDSCCSEDLFFAKLVDDTMTELDASTGGSGRTEPPAAAPASRPSAEDASAPPPMTERGERVEAARRRIENELNPDAGAGRCANGSADGGSADSPVSSYRSSMNGDASVREEGDLRLFGEEDEDEGKKTSPFIVILIILLSLITVALVWVLVVKLMYTGVIPLYDFGFGTWFNSNLFPLY